MSSAAEFVEGGVQDSCDDACSICLEAFCAEDPASVTTCNHAYHIQCILEWVQRSSDCPMCWQPLAMKDVTGQELLSSAERERSMRSHEVQVPFYPQFRSEDYELESFSSFEEQLMHYLTTRQVRGHWRRDRLHFRPMLSERSGQLLYFPTHPNTNPAAFGTTVDTNEFSSLEEEQPANAVGRSSIVVGVTRSAGHANMSYTHTSRPGSAAQVASTSEPQSFSEAIKTRLSAASSKYRDSLAKTARLLKEKFRARNVANPDAGVESRAVITGVAKAFGKMSLGSASQSRVADDIPNLDKVMDLDTKQTNFHSVASANGNSLNVDSGMGKYQVHCQDSAQLLASAGSAGGSKEMLSGSQSIVKLEQNVSIP